MKYRPHRGLLEDSMREVSDLHDRAELVRLLAKDMAKWGYKIEDADVRIEPYGGVDERTGWQTHIVTMRNKLDDTGRWYFGEQLGPDYFGAVGFTDSPE